MKAQQFADAVIAILDRSTFRRNRRLRDQIDEATESVLANMAEGFEQPSDAAVAKYLFTAKASIAEAVVRLQGAARRGWISPEESARVTAMGDEIGRMLAGWIKYLARCNYKDRGRAIRDRDRDSDLDRDRDRDGFGFGFGLAIQVYG